MFTLHSNHKGLPQSRRLKPSYSTKQATPFNRARSLAKAGSSIISSSEYLNLIEGLNMDKSLSKAPEFAVLIACRHRLFGREVTKRPRTTAWRCLRLKDAESMPRSKVGCKLQRFHIETWTWLFCRYGVQHVNYLGALSTRQIPGCIVHPAQEREPKHCRMCKWNDA